MLHITDCILFSLDGLAFLPTRLHLIWHDSLILVCSVLQLIWCDSALIVFSTAFGITILIMSRTECCCWHTTVIPIPAICCWCADGAVWVELPPRQHTAHDDIWSHRGHSCQRAGRWPQQHLKNGTLGPGDSDSGCWQWTLIQNEEWEFCNWEECDSSRSGVVDLWFLFWWD